jgi:transposase
VKLFCGIDWAEGHHDLAVIDAEGQLVAKKRITDDPAGFAELIEVLTAAGDSVEDPVPVAIETPRGLLVAALRATGRPVYAINPLAVARYRERLSVARSKSDHADAMTLAHILRVDAHLHRRLPADSELCSRSRCWPARIRTRSGHAPRLTTNYGRYCRISTPRS